MKSPTERQRLINQFLAAPVHGPEWQLPPLPEWQRKASARPKQKHNPGFGNTFRAKGKA